MTEYLPLLLLIFVFYLAYKIFFKNKDNKEITNKNNLPETASEIELNNFIESIKPQLNSSELFLDNEEFLILKLEKISLLKNKNIKTKGGYEGLSINVGSGLNYRIGRFTAKSNIKLVKVDEGNLFLTNTRLIFIGNATNEIIELSLILSIKTQYDTVITYQTNNNVIGIMSVRKSWLDLLSQANTIVADNIKICPEDNFKKLISLNIKTKNL